MSRFWCTAAPMSACLVLALATCRPNVAPTPDASDVTTVKGVGFSQPENIVYDSLADVYLVSNVGSGDPTARDDNGFISRVAPDGRVLALRWIGGGQGGAVLDGPKGLALRGDTLAVADVGGVRLFDRRSGTPLRYLPLPGVLMNDLVYAPDGSLWVTDTGPDRSGTSPTDTTKDLDAVWRIDGRGHTEALARGTALGRPDGIVLDGAGALVSTFGANRIERVGAGVRGNWSTHATLPAGRIDGLRRLSDTTLLATSWDAHSVWLLRPGAPPRALLTGVESPAGIAVDRRRHEVAVTSLKTNTLYLVRGYP